MTVRIQFTGPAFLGNLSNNILILNSIITGGINCNLPTFNQMAMKTQIEGVAD